MRTGLGIGVCVLLVLAGTAIPGCYKESILEEEDEWGITDRVLKFDQAFAFCDREDQLLLYSLPSESLNSFSPLVTFGDYHSIEFDGKKLENKKINELGQVLVNRPYRVRATKGRLEESYLLYFTNLPLLHIHTNAKIRDEPKVLAWTELAYSTGDKGAGTGLFTSYTGIEVRGRTSAVHEKKSYGLELWENSLGKDRSAALLGMREGEDWILDAMYVDPLRMRNKLSFELWEKIWKNKSNIPFRTANPGIHCEFIELFINQRYMGLYCLSERLDEKLILLDDSQNRTGAALYKAIDWQGGATAFDTYNSEPPSSMIWEGWEQIYPDGGYYWDALAELRKSVVMDPDEVFRERIDTLLNLESAAAYYLFTNLILAHDNIIKNYFLARYTGDSSFLILPWDLEGSWGIMWDGDRSSSNGMLQNGLFRRLMELDAGDFRERLEESWEHNRNSVFGLDSLTAPFIRDAGLLMRSGAIERENARWPGAAVDLEQELDYMEQWTSLRLKYLDLVFD